jgi:hypothetical protein
MSPKVKFNPKNNTFTTNIIMKFNKYSNQICVNTIYSDVKLNIVSEYSIYRFKILSIKEISEQNIEVFDECTLSICDFYNIDGIIIEYLNLDDEKVFGNNSIINFKLTFLKHILNKEEDDRLTEELLDIQNNPHNFINLFDDHFRSIIGEKYNVLKY